MIKLKTVEEIKTLREGGKHLGDILQQLQAMIAPGLNTKELEERARVMIKKVGGVPAFKGYKPTKNSKPYPSALCTSINEEVVHAPALPGKYLEQGDIIGLDIGMKYKSLFTDTAITVAVGSVDEHVQKLIDVTKECLDLAIKQVKPGNSLLDIGRTVQINAEANGFAVVRELVGHGVGYGVHESPQVLNYDSESEADDLKLEPGLVIAIEPMLTDGEWAVKVAENGFSYITKDNSLSAHFEHTVAVIDGGHVVITKSN